MYISSKYFFSLIAISLLSACKFKNDRVDWRVYGGSKTASHYSNLDDIDTLNVNQLNPVWEYHTADADSVTHSQIQCNPIIIDGIMYGTTPKLKLIALNAETGKELWVFNPADSNQNKSLTEFILNNNRGVTYWQEGNDKRIFYAAGFQLFCVNANNGKLIDSFGTSGAIDLHNDLGRNASNLLVSANTPGIIYKDLLIIGTRVDEGPDAAPGHIRAYDVHTGKLRWIFHTIPHPGEENYDDWEDKEAYKHIGGANSWAGFSMDEEKGILFAPVGSASYDFYGGKRWGNNLYANSVLALDAATGKKIWHYQTVHHDVWDRDLPTAPVLVTITKDGKKIDALAQPTKSGFVFLLDRNTGKPIYPVTETPVPTETELLGEKLSPTQPIPSFTQPFVRQLLTEKNLNHIVPDSSYQDLYKRWAATNHDHLFQPPSKKGTVIFPGFDGGAEWGGPAYDASSGLLYINASEMPWILTMIDVSKETHLKEKNIDAGKRLYTNTCTSCHGPNRQGNGSYPSLININKKYSEPAFISLINSGRRMMPSFKQLTTSEKEALASYILDIKNKQGKTFVAPIRENDPYLKLPYTSTGYNKFLTKEGYPAVDTPWGTLNALNLNTGKIVWKKTLGDYPELKDKGIHSGTENYGGPVITAGGLLFIAATSDKKIRAFNKRTGELLWEHSLPASGFATPAVFEKNNRQYVVIACGGGKLGKPSGDSYVAFALPEKK